MAITIFGVLISKYLKVNYFRTYAVGKICFRKKDYGAQRNNNSIVMKRHESMLTVSNHQLEGVC